MQYTLPTFPLTVSIYTGTSSRPPIRIVCPGNLAWGRRINLPMTITLGSTEPLLQPILLLLPALTDIRGPLQSTGSDTIVPTASKLRAYHVLFVDDFNKGTPVEFRGAWLQQATQPTPLN